VTTRLRIAEVSRRSGFTPATLRYYEEIGVLPPPARTDGGYREYDEGTLERLAFVARAKQLGCTLEEITDLSVAWEGGRCGPVQDRLRTLVSAKLADAESRLVELVTLTSELQRAAAALERHRPDGPCDDRCGCTTTGEPTDTAIALLPPSAAGGSAIACTLSAESMPGRLEEWHRLLAFVTARSAIDGGVRLELDARAPLDDVIRLTTAEHDCCRFFSFTLTVDGRGLGLEVRAPEDALPVVQAMFGMP
jgi:MerR family transcriptional regulator, copper efflux regulator